MDTKDAKLRFTIKRKSGSIRDSVHGVKTKRGSRIFMDAPILGTKCLIDDISGYTISICNNYFPYSYKIEANK